LTIAGNTRLILRLITDKKRRSEFISTYNDDLYWDSYAMAWKKNDKISDAKLLGDEWGGKDNFLLLLEKYSKPEMVALEIGCGGGRITSKAITMFKHVYATDVSKEMLEVCRQSVESTNVSFIRSDGFTLKEVPDESLDLVFSHDVFVHFSSLQVYSYFSEIKRVLKKGGISIISFYSFTKSFKRFKQISLDLWTRKVLPPGMRIHFITEEMISVMLKDLDMEIIEMNSERFLLVVFHKN